jgi:hypothetical protein
MFARLKLQRLNLALTNLPNCRSIDNESPSGNRFNDYRTGDNFSRLSAGGGDSLSEASGDRQRRQRQQAIQHDHVR